MLDGEWSLHVQCGGQAASVSATLRGGSITGDDGSYSYNGTFKTDSDGKTIAEVRVTRHIPDVGPSLNNLNDYVLLLTGSSTDKSFEGDGGIKGSQSRMYKINAKRID